MPECSRAGSPLALPLFPAGTVSYRCAMDSAPENTPQSVLAEQRQRDAVSLLMLGAFFSVLAVLVLVGTYWTVGRTHAMVVNLGAGVTLLAVGLAMLWAGRRVQALSKR